MVVFVLKFHRASLNGNEYFPVIGTANTSYGGRNVELIIRNALRNDVNVVLRTSFDCEPLWPRRCDIQKMMIPPFLPLLAS